MFFSCYNIFCRQVICFSTTINNRSYLILSNQLPQWYRVNYALPKEYNASPKNLIENVSPERFTVEIAGKLITYEMIFTS